jgi:hypothetical protein
MIVLDLRVERDGGRIRFDLRRLYGSFPNGKSSCPAEYDCERTVFLLGSRGISKGIDETEAELPASTADEVVGERRSSMAEWESEGEELKSFQRGASFFDQI